MSLKEIVKNNPRTFVYGFALVVAVGFLYMSLGSFLVDKWPSEKKIEDSVEKLKKKQKELQLELNRSNILNKNRESYIKNSPNFWIPERDGDAEINAQKRIEEAASTVGLQLTTIGRVQSSKITEGLLSFDTSVQATASIDQVMGFIEQLYKRYPRFYWANISLSPDNVKNPQKVVLNGNLRFISITDEDIIRKILGEKNDKKSK